MKILVVSSYLPFPLQSGGEVRLYNLLKRLAKKHEITLVCEIRPHQTKKDIDEVGKFCKEIIVIPRKKQWSIRNIMQAGASSHSFLITGHTLPEMKQTIIHLLASQKFDIIHVETSYIMQNLPETKIPIALTEHNIEYQVYEKYAVTKQVGLRHLLKLDIAKLKKEEESFWRQATKVVCVSDQEKVIVEKVKKGVEVVPNGVDIDVFKKKDKTMKKEKHFLYIGNYKWIQNQNALRWILQEIWPLIEKKTDESVKFVVIGRDLPSEFKRYASDRVFIEGVSEKPTHEIFSEAFALLAPLKVAGGTQYKILESMAVGTPVITTKLGTSGLNLDNEETILTGESASDVAEQAIRLVSNEKLYHQLSNNSRKHVEEHFSFDAIAEKLDKVYHELAVSG